MELTRTTTALLEGLRDSENAILWEAFDRRYRPILVGFARNLGLDEVDAADVAQETLSRFVQEYREGRYDRSRGRLGAWLVGIARYRILDLRRKQAGSRQVAEPEALASLDDEQHLSRIWDETPAGPAPGGDG